MLGSSPLGANPLGAEDLTSVTALNTTQAGVMAAVAGGGDLRVTQAAVLTAINFPTEELRTTQAGIMTAVKSAMPIRVTQARVLAAVRGRVDNSRVRAWTFTLDGHDFYILRLGDLSTLVYDTYSEQWYEWDGEDRTTWRLNLGANWLGASALAKEYGSSILVGDDTLGVLWFLDPNLGYDQDPDLLDDDPHPFTRVVSAQVPVQGRDNIRCNNVFILADMGQPALTGGTVTLSMSDDVGQTFSDQGSITVVAGNYKQELYWPSLGQITAPGRIFKITDDGAVTRIDAMEMNSRAGN